jgi:hypothetical protein
MIQLQDIVFDDGQNVKDFLEMNDPDFLRTYSSGRVHEPMAGSPHQQKLLFLSRMLAMGNHLVDDSKHTYPSAGTDSPAQTGLAYSWGSKDYHIRQIPPTTSGCMDKKIYGLDCSGMLWAMTQAAGITVEPKYNFFVEYVSSASKWTKAFKASADYKDLKMKNEGQLPRYKMKNGDIILWKQHVGVYLQGKFYQSNGTSKAPGCKDNLQSNRGPRVISADEVLRWGLGAYKVFRIDLDFNFKLTVELIENDPCAYLSQHSEDKIELDIKVEEEEVTISNVINYNQTIHPVTITIVNDCSLTCLPSGAGHFNVTHATGKIQHDEKHERLIVELKNTGSTTPSITLQCPEWDPIETASQMYEFDDSYYFVLEDSLQTQYPQGQYGLFVKLEPR